MLNKVILIGNLGADPEVRHTPNGNAVTNFNLAVTSGYGDNQYTEWVSCVAWKRLAEICGEFLHKGSRIYGEGRLQTRKWDDQDGNTRYKTEVILNEMKMLGEKVKVDKNDYTPPEQEDELPF